MKIHGEGIPRRCDQKLSHDAPDCATVITAMGDYMDQHFFTRHGSDLRIGESERHAFSSTLAHALYLNKEINTGDVLMVLGS